MRIDNENKRYGDDRDLFQVKREITMALENGQVPTDLVKDAMRIVTEIGVKNSLSLLPLLDKLDKDDNFIIERNELFLKVIVYERDAMSKLDLLRTNADSLSKLCNTEIRAEELYKLKETSPNLVILGLLNFIKLDLESMGVDREQWQNRFLEVTNLLHPYDADFFRNKANLKTE